MRVVGRLSIFCRKPMRDLLPSKSIFERSVPPKVLVPVIVCDVSVVTILLGAEPPPGKFVKLLPSTAGSFPFESNLTNLLAVLKFELFNSDWLYVVIIVSVRSTPPAVLYIFH